VCREKIRIFLNNYLSSREIDVLCSAVVQYHGSWRWKRLEGLLHPQGACAGGLSAGERYQVYPSAETCW